MLYHNLVLSLRSFARYKSTFLINLVGLASGLTCVVLIMLWVSDELSVDRFHDKEERLYQIMNNFKTTDGIQTLDATPVPLAASLKADMPEVEYAVSVNNFFSWHTRTGILTASDTVHVQAGGWHAGEDFFNVFSYKLVQGDKRSVLTDKNNIVISEALAKKLFPGTNDVIGKSLEWKHPYFQGVFTVSGVFESLLRNSTARFDFLIGMDILLDNDRWAKEWTGNYASTYVVLKDGTNIDNFNKKIEWLLGTKKSELKDKFQLFAQLYKDRYLNGHYENGRSEGGRIVYVRLFSVVALFILAIACINFMNLSTAKATLRMKEIGIKKTIGAARSSLIARFMTEAVLLVIFAMIIAIPLVILLLPSFNEIADKNLTLSPDKSMFAGVVGMVLLSGMLSGSYPSFYLSGFRPAVVLKGKIGEGWGLLTTQMNFMQNQDLGYDKDQMLVVRATAIGDSTYGSHVSQFVNTVKQLPQVQHVARSTDVPGHVINERNNVRRVTQDENGNVGTFFINTDENFFATYGMKILAGRNLTEKDQFIYVPRDVDPTRERIITDDGYLVSGAPNRIMINEALAESLGFKKPEDAINEKVVFEQGRKFVGEITAVIKNHNQLSLREKYQPVIYYYPMYDSWSYFSIKVDLRSSKTLETINQIGKLYSDAFPTSAYEYFFLDDHFNNQYKNDVQFTRIFGVFTILAIIISSLGLLGLGIFSVTQRIKEIGIRRVLGSSVFQILLLFSKDSFWLLVIAYGISLPVIMLGISNWLDNFAFHVGYQWQMFILPPMLLLTISLVTIVFVTLKSAATSPAVSLKTE